MLCGGGSSAPGLGARLLRELRGLAPQNVAPGLYGVPDYMPEGTLRHAAWMGGAVLARVSFSQSGARRVWSAAAASPKPSRCCPWRRLGASP